jgi:hypothetical protein
MTMNKNLKAEIFFTPFIFDPLIDMNNNCLSYRYTSERRTVTVTLNIKNNNNNNNNNNNKINIDKLFLTVTVTLRRLLSLHFVLRGTSL